MLVPRLVVCIGLIILGSVLWPDEFNPFSGAWRVQAHVWVQAVLAAGLWFEGMLLALSVVRRMRRFAHGQARGGAGTAEGRTSGQERRAGADRRKAQRGLPAGVTEERRKSDRREAMRSAIARQGEARQEIEALLARGATRKRDSD